MCTHCFPSQSITPPLHGATLNSKALTKFIITKKSNLSLHHVVIQLNLELVTNLVEAPLNHQGHMSAAWYAHALKIAASNQIFSHLSGISWYTDMLTNLADITLEDLFQEITIAGELLRINLHHAVSQIDKVLLARLHFNYHKLQIDSTAIFQSCLNLWQVVPANHHARAQSASNRDLRTSLYIDTASSGIAKSSLLRPILLFDPLKIL